MRQHGFKIISEFTSTVNMCRSRSELVSHTNVLKVHIIIIIIIIIIIVLHKVLVLLSQCETYLFPKLLRLGLKTVVDRIQLSLLRLKVNFSSLQKRKKELWCVSDLVIMTIKVHVRNNIASQGNQNGNFDFLEYITSSLIWRITEYRGKLINSKLSVHIRPIVWGK
jgi:hypothetical protein